MCKKEGKKKKRRQEDKKEKEKEKEGKTKIVHPTMYNTVSNILLVGGESSDGLGL